MKKILVLSAALTGLAMTNAFAGDSMTACEEFAANNGVPPEPCACIADAVSGDSALQEEQIALATMEDWENASDELHAVLDPCIEG